jgi:hypothetical protein
MDLETHSSLQPGERLLWSDRPQRFSPNVLDLFPFVIGLVWLGFGVLTFLMTVTGAGAPIIIPFLFVGLGLTVTWGRIVLRLVALRSTTYLLTDRRVIVVSTYPRQRELSEYLIRLEPPVVRPGPDGTGTIRVGMTDALQLMAKSYRRGSPPGGGVIELRAIPDAAVVRDLIANAQANAAREPF